MHFFAPKKFFLSRSKTSLIAIYFSSLPPSGVKGWRRSSHASSSYVKLLPEVATTPFTFKKTTLII